MTIQQLNKLNPAIYVITDGIVFIAPSGLSGINYTDDERQAERWSYADTLSIKLSYFRAVTGLKLRFDQIAPMMDAKNARAIGTPRPY